MNSPKCLFSFFLVFWLTTSLTAQQLPQQWLRTFQAQGKNQDRIADITTDAAGNVYVAGYAGNHHGAPDAFAMKRNPQGDTLWTYYYDGGTNDYDYAIAIAVDAAGYAYITGESENTPSNNECFTAKLAPNGTEEWVSRYSPGGNMQSKGNALVVDASGNVYVAGFCEPLSGSMDWLVIKYNATGVQQWADVLNGPGNYDDEALDIAIAPNGNPVVCGYMYSVNTSGYFNSFVKQYTPSNGTVWTQTWTNPSFTGTDKALGIGYNLAGEVLIGGETNNSASFTDAFAIKYDASGNQVWSTIYADTNTLVNEYISEIIVDATGNVYFTGTDYQDGYITKINNDGSQGWRKEWRGPVSNGYDIFHGITVDNAGNVYATGRGVYPGVDYYLNGGIPNIVITKYNELGDSLWTYRCADSLNSSMAFALTYHDGKVYSAGFVTDTAYVDENLFTIIADTSGNPVSEWSYNGRGDSYTNGQFVVTDANDNVYCAATTDRLYAQGYDVSIVKYDPAGTLLWEKYYSSPGWNNDSLTGLQIDPAGNLILSISTDSLMVQNTYQLSLLKMDQNGSFLDTAWYFLPGNNHAKSMAIRGDGSIALGTNSSPFTGMLLFFDAAFNGLWAAKLDSTQFAVTRTNAVDIFPNGDIAVGGSFEILLSGNKYGLVQRYSPAGTKLWSTLIDSAYDEVMSIDIDSAGDVAITGLSGGNNYGTLVGKLNGSNGNLLWRQFYNPNTINEYGVKVSFTPAGNIVLISRGWTGFVSRYFTVQYSGSGNFQWANIYSNAASDREPVDIFVQPSGRVVTAGWAINTYSTNYDYVLTGYTSSGAVDFTNTWNSTGPFASTWDQLFDLTGDSQGDFIVTGRMAWEFYNNYLYKMVTIKYGGIPVGISENQVQPNSSVLIYPNPSSDGNYHLLDANPGGFLKGYVYDVQGKLVKVIPQGSESFSLSEEPLGLFNIVLQRCDLSIETIRVVKCQ